MNRFISRFALSSALAFTALCLTACGGGSGEAPPVSVTRSATALSYTDPTGTGWRLVKQPESTSTRLVLGLVGPSGLKSRGVGFNLSLGRGAHFATFADGGYAQDTGVFQLKGSNPNFEPYAGTDADPVLFASRLKDDRLLTTGIFQKDRTYSAKSLAAPVVRVVIELDANSALQQGGALALSVPKARHVPDDIGGMDFIVNLDTLAKARMEDIQIEVGRVIGQ